MFGRNSEAPIPVLAPATPVIASGSPSKPAGSPLKYMVPVIILSDGYLANGAEPWQIPNVDDIPEFPVKFATDPARFPAL